MSKPLTIRELYKECENEMRKGNGNKIIMISDDDEGNGYHYLWYSFAEPDELLEDYMISEDIATKEDTIILG